ncbi:MAG: acyltransferase family protein [Thermoanaerobaculia bacterium]
MTENRLVSLDVFRGLTIAGMIVVNNPGTWDHVYPPLLHAEWHGWTYTDTIFPFFLFIIGVAMAFSFAGRSAVGAGRWALVPHTFRRAAIIFGLGLGINALSILLFHRAHVRIPGVLQRIAVCFFFAALVYLLGGRNAIRPAILILLFGYWALMALVPVPGHGVGQLDLDGNFATYVDRLVLGEHTWKHNPSWDPEGLVSTLPAIATTLMGLLAGLALRFEATIEKKIVRLLLWGWVGGIAGILWDRFLPINKNLWTSSYALFMSGLAAACLGVCLWAVDLRGWRAWSKPFEWLGKNALFLFVASDVVTILLIWIKLEGADGKRRSLYGTIDRAVFDHFADPRLGSLLFALTYCALWTAAAGLLDRKRIFIKV